jgi:hypothetical protein
LNAPAERSFVILAISPHVARMSSEGDQSGSTIGVVSGDAPWISAGSLCSHDARHAQTLASASSSTQTQRDAAQGSRTQDQSSTTSLTRMKGNRKENSGDPGRWNRNGHTVKNHRQGRYWRREIRSVQHQILTASTRLTKDEHDQESTISQRVQDEQRSTIPKGSKT